MTNNDIIVQCKRVKFYASHDEAAFFEWANKIKSIHKIQGKRDSILLTVDSTIADEDLYNLVALFRRYKIRMNSLEAIVNDTNREEFEDYQKGYSINVYPAGE